MAAFGWRSALLPNSKVGCSVALAGDVDHTGFTRDWLRVEMKSQNKLMKDKPRESYSYDDGSKCGGKTELNLLGLFFSRGAIKWSYGSEEAGLGEGSDRRIGWKPRQFSEGIMLTLVKLAYWEVQTLQVLVGCSSLCFSSRTIRLRHSGVSNVLGLMIRYVCVTVLVLFEKPAMQ